jgi:hypothetical protein
MSCRSALWSNALRFTDYFLFLLWSSKTQTIYHNDVIYSFVLCLQSLWSSFSQTQRETEYRKYPVTNRNCKSLTSNVFGKRNKERLLIMTKNRRTRGRGRTLGPAHTELYPKFRLQAWKSDYLDFKHGLQRKKLQLDSENQLAYTMFFF